MNPEAGDKQAALILVLVLFLWFDAFAQGAGNRNKSTATSTAARDSSDAVTRRRAHITFLLDVSSSMTRDNKMKLLKNSAAELLNLLNGNDMITLMTFSDIPKLLYHTSSYKGPDSLLKMISKVRSTASATNINAGINDSYTHIHETHSTAQTKKKPFSLGAKNGRSREYLARDNYVLLITDGLFELNNYTKQLVCDDPGIKLICVIVGKGIEADRAVTYVREELQLKVITLVDEEKDVKRLTEIFDYQ